MKKKKIKKSFVAELDYFQQDRHSRPGLLIHLPSTIVDSFCWGDKVKIDRAVGEMRRD